MAQMNVYLSNHHGTTREAFDFYEKLFGAHPLKALSQNYRAKADFPITFDAATTPEPVHLMMRMPLPEDPPITMNFPALLARYLPSPRKSQ